MGKKLVFSKEVYSDYNTNDKYEELNKLLNKFIDDSNEIIFISRNTQSLKELQQCFSKHNIQVRTETRENFKNELKSNKANIQQYIIIGNRDKDFEIAVNNKLLYIIPMWCKEKNNKCIKYGVRINNLVQLDEIIKTVNNQSRWYYHDVLDDGTEVYSLTSGNTKLSGISTDEKEIVNGFEAYLKKGTIDYYEILFYHFLAGISNSKLFREIDMWGIAPSSGTTFSVEMMSFKDRARYLMKKRFAKEGDNLIIRYTPIKQSKMLASSIREKEGAGRLLSSMYLNPSYTVKGKVICIFDDYMTHGNTFEAIRNLLKAAKAKKIIFVSLGRFKRNYIYQDYQITGNVSKPNGFTFKEKSRKVIDFKCDDVARKEVENLHQIFNLQ